MIDEKSSEATTESYLDNFKILADAAQELREQEVADIDRLVPLVDKALAAYTACKSRISAVEKMLADRLGEALPNRKEEAEE